MPLRNVIDGREPAVAGETLDHYFFQQMQKITPQQIESLPPEIRTIVRRGPAAATKQLKIEQKRKVMVEAFGFYAAEIWFDPDGMNADDFIKIFDSRRRKGKSKEVANLMQEHNIFVLGNKLFVRTMEYLEMICASDIYKLADKYRSDVKIKGGRSQKIRDVQEAFKYITRLLVHYEKAANNFVRNYGLKRADLFMFFYLFGEPTQKSRQQFYDMFQGAAGAGKNEMKMAWTRLKQAGYIQPKNDREKPAFYYMTSRGESVFKNFIKSVLVDF